LGRQVDDQFVAGYLTRPVVGLDDFNQSGHIAHRLGRGDNAFGALLHQPLETPRIHELPETDHHQVVDHRLDLAKKMG
jgi:hypothetical protein